MQPQVLPAIERGVPIPRHPQHRKCRARLVMESLEVDESFIYPQSPRGHRHTVSLAATRMNMLAPKKFCMRTLSKDGKTILRVWRIK